AGHAPGRCGQHWMAPSGPIALPPSEATRDAGWRGVGGVIMSTQRLLTSVLAVAAGLVLFACNGGPEGEPLATTDADLFAEDAARAVEVELRDIAFGPTDLTVGAGELVELAIVHTGSLDHDFTIDRILAQVSM